MPEPEISPEALRCLESYAWPGNVRELEHTVEALSIACNDKGHIGIEDVYKRLRRGDLMSLIPALRHSEAIRTGPRMETISDHHVR